MTDLTGPDLALAVALNMGARMDAHRPAETDWIAICHAIVATSRTPPWDT